MLVSGVRRRLIVLFGAFIMLGLPEGVLGTAWPSMRASLDRPESALAQVIIAYTLGYFVSTIGVGWLVERLGMQTAVRLGVGLSAIGMAGYAISPAWQILVAGAFTLGCGAGVVDASVNAEVAVHHGPRTMNLLHASFGIGATLGPLFVTGLLGLDLSWRIAYGGLCVIELAVLVALLPGAAGTETTGSAETAESYGPRAARPTWVLAATLLYFAAYVGAEVSIGQWSFTVLTEQRGVGQVAAGIAVAAYWGGLTVGRLALSALGTRLHPMTVLRGAGAVALMAMSWFLSDSFGSLLALPLVGLAFAGVFPALVLMTSSWLPQAMVTKAVGWQLAASSAGAIAASVLFRTVSDRYGLQAIVAAMVGLVAALVLGHLITTACVSAGSTERPVR